MKRLSDQTLYEILEIPTDAPPEEIGRAYERLHGLYEPGSLVTYTLVTPDEAALLNNRIEEAKVVLLDPGARQRYDERLGIASATPASVEPSPHGPSQPPVPPAGTPVPITGAASASPWPPPATTSPPASSEDRPVSPGLPFQPEAPVVEGPAVAAPPLPPLALTQPVAAPLQLTQEVAPPELPDPDANHWTGPLLKQVREARGVTLQQLAEKTRVTRHHLENIEGERWKALPAPVYLRGILMALARELRLDGQKVARSYLVRAGTGEPLEPPTRR